MTDPKDWPANRRLWVEALRDKSRRQVQGRLGHQEYDDGQCCLGLLAELAGCTFRFKEMNTVYGRGQCLWNEKSVFSPQRAMEFVGLRTASGRFDADPAYLRTASARNFVGDPALGGSLAALNDKQKASFAVIADVVEQEPPGLFREIPE